MASSQIPPSSPVAGALKALRSALACDDAEDRRQATAELGRVPVDEAVPLLLASLGDEDWRVRKEATLVARSFGGARALLAALVEVFAGGDNVGLRNAAVEVLASAGHAATAALAEALPRLDADGRKLAVETLGRGRDPAALGALELALADGDANVREGAMEAIAGLGPLAPERVAELLLARLDDGDRLVRLTALEGLTALEVAIPWARLARLLEEPTLRSAALSAAALASSPEAARALTVALAHARGGAFDQALRALGRLAEGPLAPSVAAALHAAGADLGQRLVAAALADGSGDEVAARRAMALRLAALGSRDGGAPGLIDAAVSALTEDLLAEAAQQALLTLGPAALPSMFERLADPAVPPEARAALVDVIAEILGSTTEGPPLPEAASLAGLRGAARDPERAVAVRALRALSDLGDEEDLALAAEQTMAPLRAVAVAAEGALAALAGRFPMAARALADRVARTSTDERLLLPAVIVIGALGASSAFEERDAIFLAHAATAGDTRARRAAVEAVSALRGSVGAGVGVALPAAMEVLSFALTDEEHEVQMAAARALGRLCSAPDAPRAADVLDLVNRSGAADLVAAAVRAIGEGMSVAYQQRRSIPPTPPSADLVASLALLARGAPSPVAIAAVDSLGQAQRARAGHDGGAAIDALAAALAHPDEDVVKAALLKLADCAAPLPSASAPVIAAVIATVIAAIACGLEHPAAAVRLLAVEILAERAEDAARAALARRLGVEPDRRVDETVRRALVGFDADAPGLVDPDEGG